MSLPLPVGKPFYVKPYIRSGRAHLALGHADAAREQFEMALQEISVAKGSGRGADVADDEESARKGLEHCRKYVAVSDSNRKVATPTHVLAARFIS